MVPTDSIGSILSALRQLHFTANDEYASLLSAAMIECVAPRVVTEQLVQLARSTADMQVAARASILFGQMRSEVGDYGAAIESDRFGARFSTHPQLAAYNGLLHASLAADTAAVDEFRRVLESRGSFPAGIARRLAELFATDSLHWRALNRSRPEIVRWLMMLLGSRGMESE